MFSFYPFDTFQRVDVLLSVRSADDSIRALLCRQLGRSRHHFHLDGALATLQRAEVPVQQCIDALLELLRVSCHPASAIQAPDILDAMARLGHAREQIAELVVQLLSKHGEALSPGALLRLAERPELTDSIVAKILLRALARRAHGSVAQWLTRFTSQESSRGDGTHWLEWPREGFLHLRLRGLKKLSQVNDSGFVDAVLAELADAAAANDILPLYRRVQAGGHLSDAEWYTLTMRLERHPTDDSGSLFAKEWLTLILWTTLEPETVDSLIRI